MDLPVISTGTTSRVMNASDDAETDETLAITIPEVIEHIFRFIPPSAVVEYRALSKYWNAVLKSKVFLQTHRGESEKNLYCFLYDIVTKRVEIHDSVSRTLRTHCGNSFFPMDSDSQKVVVLSSRAGILLLELFPDPLHSSITVTTRKFLLWNPANGSVRLLPALESSSLGDVIPTQWWKRVLSLDFNVETKSLQILARKTLSTFGRPGEILHHIRHMVYDVQLNAWDMICESTFPLGHQYWDERYVVLDSAVLYHGFWYYLAYIGKLQPVVIGETEPSSPHILRVRRGEFGFFEVEMPSNPGMEIHFLQVFVSKGKLILAATLKQHSPAGFIWMGFHFWELDEKTFQWVYFLEVPRSFVTYGSHDEMIQRALNLKCFAEGDHIGLWFNNSSWQATPVRNMEMVMYCVSKKHWWTITSDNDLRRPEHMSPTSSLSWICANISWRWSGAKRYSHFLWSPNFSIFL